MLSSRASERSGREPASTRESRPPHAPEAQRAVLSVDTSNLARHNDGDWMVIRGRSLLAGRVPRPELFVRSLRREHRSRASSGRSSSGLLDIRYTSASTAPQSARPDTPRTDRFHNTGPRNDPGHGTDGAASWGDMHSAHCIMHDADHGASETPARAYRASSIVDSGVHGSGHPGSRARPKARIRL